MSLFLFTSLRWSRLPNTMAQNLSVPLAFVALLHLANEKVSFVYYEKKRNCIFLLVRENRSLKQRCCC